MKVIRILILAFIGALLLLLPVSARCMGCVADIVVDRALPRDNHVPAFDRVKSSSFLSILGSGDPVLHTCEKRFRHPGPSWPVLDSFSDAVHMSEGQTNAEEISNRGCVSWELFVDTDSGLPIVSGTILIPERDLTLEIRFSTYESARLPTVSHVVDVGIDDKTAASREQDDELLALLIKPAQGTDGQVFKGVILPMSASHFMIVVDGGTQQTSENLALLRTHSWFDLVILRGDGTRSLIGFSKGKHGKMLFDLALAAWKKDR